MVPERGESFDFEFDGDSLVLGRSEEADLVVPDRFLSRLHSRLYRQHGQLQVEDLGSRNGTRVNGRPVRQSAPVKVGDVLQLSGSSISIHAAHGTNAPKGAKPLALGETQFWNASHLLAAQEPENAEAIRGESELLRYAERMRKLNRAYRALAHSIELEEILELVLDRLFEDLEPEQGVIFLRDAEGELEARASRSIPGVETQDLTSRSLAREVADKGLAALVLDLESDKRFAAAESIHDLGVRSLVAAPLLGPEGSIGMVVLSSKATVRQFSEEDMELLVAMASAAALGIRNVYLATEVAERRLMDKELTLARRIQVALLPHRMPEIPGYDVQAGNIPSRHVSGDYYVALERAEGSECALMIADVAGKGIAASLLTASLEALAAGPIEDGLPADKICHRLSRQLYRRTTPERYATTFLAILKVASGKLAYANAGHVAGLLIRPGGEVVNLATTGPPLGLVERVDFDLETVSMEPGDLLVLCTDGITEAADPEDEEYGLDHLAEICRRHLSSELTTLQSEIEEDLERFAKGIPVEDDRTVLMLRRHAD